MKILNCTQCGKCLSCSYLEKYGYPKEIYLKRDKSVFLCTNCGMCSLVCPFDVDPAQALYKLKSELIEEGSIDDNIEKTLKNSRSFVKKISSFPIAHIDYKKNLYFPGCAMLGAGKKINKSLKKILEKKLAERLGWFIYCCGDPMWQNGDKKNLLHHMEILKEELENASVEKIFVACANCKKVFKEYLEGIDVVHILEIVSTNDFKKMPKDNYFLHHPCPNFREKNIMDSMDKIFLKEDTEKNKFPSCCGLGGSVSILDEGLSFAFTEKVKNMSLNKHIVTSCFGCKKKFTKSNLKAKHLYEFLTGIFIEKPITSIKQWINRLYISISVKVNLKKLLLLFFLILLSFYVYDLQSDGKISLEKILLFLRSSKYLAPMAYLFLYMIGPSIFFPSLLMTVAAGVIWGTYLGFVLAITGATLGSSVSFLLSRYIFGDFVKRTFGLRRWQKLNELVKKHGWKVVAFTRVVPIFPFPVLNYLFGITPISFFQYLWPTILFMMPACIAFVFFGSSIFDLILKGELTPIILSILFISLVMLLPILVKRLIKKDE